MNKWMNEWKHYLSVKVFSTKELTGDTTFTSPTGDGTAILRGDPREGLAACSAKGVPSFLSYFKTLSIGPASEIESATSRSAVKRSTDWANPAVKFLNHEWMNEQTNEWIGFIYSR